MLGINMLVFLAPLGVIALGSLIIEVSQKANRWQRTSIAAIMALLSVCCAIITILSWIYLLKPATVYNYDDDQQNVLENDALLVLIGGFIAMAFTPLTLGEPASRLVLLATRPDCPTHDVTFFSFLSPQIRARQPVTAYLATYHLTYRPATFRPKTSRQPLTRSSFKENWKPIAMLFLLFLVWGFSDGTFSAVWNYSAHSYFMATSSFAVIETEVDNQFYFKVYEDTLVYFAFLTFVVVLGVITHFSPRIQRTMHTRYKVYAPLSSYLPYGVTVGETLLLLAVAGLAGYWLYFWRWGYDRITVRAIKYHRALGVIVWTLVTSHMILWMIKWLRDSTLLHNIFTIDDLKITHENIHYDNFTIVMVETAWLLMTIMVGLALWTRRSSYELFYFTHYFGIFFYIAALVHAWSFWYYTIGGLVLWLYDRCMRIVSASGPVDLKNAYYDIDAGVVRVSMPASDQIQTRDGQLLTHPLDTGVLGSYLSQTVLHWNKPGFQHRAGQYAWICVPYVSHLEWHPFTISSHPSASEHTFHIKAMGKNTWTERLAHAVERDPHMITLRIDGPYGRPEYFDQCSNLLLVAGGIGITPIYAILSELSELYNSGEGLGKIRKVTLVWCMRQPALRQTFAQMIMMAARQSEVFDIKLYFTRGDVGSFGRATDEVEGSEKKQFLDSCVRKGRPDLDSIASKLPSGRDTMLMVCGPQPMIKECSDIAFAYDFSMHHEVFTF
ncbi:uncharacterized protein MONBRDRAFT_37160 [Monosiga brevicollis MX1]|uniref:FAD-binding FR-type domain-containing protein n=1 Tax=Monosiga brevicollis TaxID=81824 RepID=A9UZZ7_MONBE|nr:uncharacterized protein MONBRDRAFT_37160 [Monosiga brevicollis MX1]EDQ89066.1 predicted protein [Monosiga brevicollis MX1]|eukprot:XP_001746171.1 hypothetical protein [Monosiga brevicollis MX1]